LCVVITDRNFDQFSRRFGSSANTLPVFRPAVIPVGGFVPCSTGGRPLCLCNECFGTSKLVVPTAIIAIATTALRKAFIRRCSFRRWCFSGSGGRMTKRSGLCVQNQILSTRHMCEALLTSFLRDSLRWSHQREYSIKSRACGFSSFVESKQRWLCA